MPNANWSNPTLTSTYTNFVTEVKTRDEDLALQFDGTTSTNIPTNAIRWDSAASRWKKWNGSSWVELTGVYALTALTTNGDTSIVARHNGNGATWYGRILSMNATSDRAAFLGVYQSNAGVFAHNNALSAWADLYVNTASGGNDGGAVRMPSTVFLNGNQALHAGNYSSYSPTLTGTGASGTWGINVTGSASTALRIQYNDGPRDLSDRLPNSFQRTVNFDFVTAPVGNGTGNYAGVMTYSPWLGTTASTGDASYQLAFANNSGVNASGQPKLSIRNGIDSTWNSWYTLLHSGNYNSYSPTLTGTGASGTWAINVTGSASSASTAVNLSTTRLTWGTNGTLTAVVGQLAWKNYSNGHTIFDASHSTSPDGGTVNNTNAASAWVPTYPALMGWNGTSTFGVRVDSARLADNVTGPVRPSSGGSASAPAFSTSADTDTGIYFPADGYCAIATNNVARGYFVPEGGFRLFPQGTGPTVNANDAEALYVYNTSASKLGAGVVSANGSFDLTTLYLNCHRSNSEYYVFLACDSGNSTDREFALAGNGNAFADGSWIGGGADYAEYFEWVDGNTNDEDRRGLSVVLDGDKIRPALAGEDPFGVISGNPSVVGDAAWNKWSGKYLRDDYGTFIREEHEVIRWLDENDAEVTYEDWNLPPDLTIPEDAEYLTHDDKGNRFTHRKLNPDYDAELEYVPREQRPEWSAVGLVGKLRIRKGQPVGSRWLKMRDVSGTVEEWLVR